MEDDAIASMRWHFLVDSSYVCPYCPNAQTRFDTYYQLKSHLVTHKTEQVISLVTKLNFIIACSFVVYMYSVLIAAVATTCLDQIIVDYIGKETRQLSFSYI